MLTCGIVVLDGEGRYLFEAPEIMKNPLTNHHFFFRALTEESLIVYGRKAWNELGTRIPASNTSKVIIGMSVAEVRKAFPHKNIYAVGNRTVLRDLDIINTLVVIQYKQTFDLKHGDHFPIPQKPLHQKMLALTPNYRIDEYTLAQLEGPLHNDSFQVTTIDPPFKESDASRSGFFAI